MMTEVMKINPNTRLLKMLGEDLIKDEKTAVIELVKNSYDADARRVRIFFENFSDEFEASHASEIFIIDDGEGMSKNEIKNNWLSPGTDNKKRKKKVGEKTSLGRVYQGEKGIGRYSMLKLARSVEVFSKKVEDNLWNHAKVDLSDYDEDYISEEEHSSNLLSDLNILYDNQECLETSLIPFIEEKGTIIKLTNLNGNWNAKKATEIYNDLARLEPITKLIHGWQSNKEINSYFNEFKIEFYLNGIKTIHEEVFLNDLEKFLNLQEKKCILSIKNGIFDDKTGTFEFYANDINHRVNVNDNVFRKLPAFKRYFEEERENFKIKDLKCGPFNFEFYAFHFNSREKYLEDYRLTHEEKALIENHRIYLYRDNARVYPYGETKNDWLSIDALRGLIKANAFLTNGQTVGFVSISYDKNPKLQDKSNREGLIEEDDITFEFIALLQSLLNYIRVIIYNNEVKKIKDVGKKKENDRKKILDELEKRKQEELANQIKKEQEEKRKNQDKLAKQELQLKEKEVQLNTREEKIKRKENRIEEEIREEMKDKVSTQIVMTEEEEEFFKSSDVIKSSFIGEKIPMGYNPLLEQLSRLNYNDFYLLYSLVFRVFIEDITKKYNVSRNLSDRRGLGEKVNLMINDMLDIVKDNNSSLTANQKNELLSLLGGKEPFKNELNVIKAQFYKDGQQQILATKLNSFTHNPKYIERKEALSIANNTILPLIILSQKIISYVESDVSYKKI
ncbi:ATP-binding protein [Oceanobacillus sp. FSL W8-0428]|uniref:ATP-binding protein n=1 Tax=Oceanobacillus sp. FSL W8-0428 TaxID=2921715 RepID=UPI0030FB6766